MASSVSGQNESNIALWLATLAGKMELSFPLWTSHRKNIFPENHIYNKSFIDQACSIKMAWYWPRSFFFFEFLDLDSVSVHEHAQKNLANIQPSWPHTLSMTIFINSKLINSKVFLFS